MTARVSPHGTGRFGKYASASVSVDRDVCFSFLARLFQELLHVHVPVQLASFLMPLLRHKFYRCCPKPSGTTYFICLQIRHSISPSDLIINHHRLDPRLTIPLQFLLSPVKTERGLPPASLKPFEAPRPCGVIIIISYVLFVNNFSMRQ